MLMTARLLALSDCYSAATGMSRSRISTIVFNDGKALGRISAGGDLNTRSFEKAMFWFASNWPEGAAWPEGVDRPLDVTFAEQSEEGAAA